jgi:hypothetical protein
MGLVPVLETSKKKDVKSWLSSEKALALSSFFSDTGITFVQDWEDESL